ncbi:MAG: hypothetical protein Q4G04_03550 [bacterium]|nr:hypothetical protein [bacterium]
METNSWQMSLSNAIQMEKAGITEMAIYYYQKAIKLGVEKFSNEEQEAILSKIYILRHQCGHMEKNYDIYKAVQHIAKHYTDDCRVLDSSYFSPDFDIEQFFIKWHKNWKLIMKNAKFTKKNIVSKYIGSPIDEYIITSRGCGYRSDNGGVNHLRIVTIGGTHNIITMYPYAKPVKKRKKS